jgi:hypothetical protein
LKGYVALIASPGPRSVRFAFPLFLAGGRQAGQADLAALTLRKVGNGVIHF